jgi:hypothetical protein
MGMLQRGRAIVRRLPPGGDGRTYRPGDFLLTRSEGAIARVLGLATGGSLNHAALIVDASGGLIEANPCVMSGEPCLRRSHIEEYLAAGKSCWVGYVEVQEGTRQSVVEFAERLCATQGRFSEVGVLALLLQSLLCIAPRAHTARHRWLRPLHALFDRHALVLREEHTYLSGEFVARALERGGFVWERDPAHITPDELFARFHLHDDVEGGVLLPLAVAWVARRDGHAEVLPARGPAHVSLLVPRNARSSARSAHTAALRLEADRAPANVAEPDGVRAILHVMLWTLGGLTVTRGVEVLLHGLQRD